MYLKAGPNDQVPEEFVSFDAFTKALRTLYGDPNLERNALTAVDHLKQTGSVAQYISRFAIHAPHTNLNDTGLRQAFYKNLKEGLKDELATRDYSTLKELQTLATKLDSRIRERRDEIKAESSVPRQPTIYVPKAQIRPPNSAPSIAPVYRPTALAAARPAPAARPSPTPSAPAADGSTPMELDSLRVGKLTPEEKERCVREGRCFRCRQQGHMIPDCQTFQIAELELNMSGNGEAQE
jgi:hypothetical protein